MKIDQKLPISQQEPSYDKRFSIKEFFKDDPETIQWMKLHNEHSVYDSVSTTQQEDYDNLVKSVVRGMINNIDLQILVEEYERLGYSE